MTIHGNPPRIPLSSNWHRGVKPAMLHVVSLAPWAIAHILLSETLPMHLVRGPLMRYSRAEREIVVAIPALGRYDPRMRILKREAVMLRQGQ